jgi:hypothetical protein
LGDNQVAEKVTDENELEFILTRRTVIATAS